jgi:hypothetical protein
LRSPFSCAAGVLALTAFHLAGIDVRLGVSLQFLFVQHGLQFALALVVIKRGRRTALMKPLLTGRHFPVDRHPDDRDSRTLHGIAKMAIE